MGITQAARQLNLSIGYVRELVDTGQIEEFDDCDVNTRLLYEDSVLAYKEARADAQAHRTD